MTEAERDRLTAEWFDAHAHEVDAWNGLPLAEQAANLDKINAAWDANGPAAARTMARALGLPMPPEELAPPDHELEAYRAEGEQWMRECAAQLGLSPAEIEQMVTPTPTGRTDH